LPWASYLQAENFHLNIVILPDAWASLATVFIQLFILVPAECGMRTHCCSPGFLPIRFGMLVYQNTHTHTFTRCQCDITGPRERLPYYMYTSPFTPKISRRTPLSSAQTWDVFDGIMFHLRLPSTFGSNCQSTVTTHQVRSK
jgi:hypothetical protein